MIKFNLSNYVEKPAKKIAKRMVYKDKNVISFILNIAAGESLPEHTHFDCTVLIKVIKGSAYLSADDSGTPIQEGDLIQIEGTERMSVDNNDKETLILYVTISPAPPEEKYAVDADL